MDDDADSDYIDSNYVWQQRSRRVLRDSDVATQFPRASALGVEFNPAFARAEKIPADLLTNGVILDIHDFTKAMKKMACHHLFDILQFNFDLGLNSDGPECFDFAYQLYPALKRLHGQLRGRPKLQETMGDVYALPEVAPENTDVASEGKKSQIWTDDERKGDPIFIKKGLGQPHKLSMSNYPLCKNLGVTFVLRSSNAPAQKLSTTLLTTGMVLEMLDFAEFLGGQFVQTLKDLILHNFGEVYESCYLSSQVRALHDKKLSHSLSDREAFCEQPFEFMLKKRTNKREAELDSKVEIIPEKRRSAMTHLSKDYLWEEKTAAEESSYMCPVEFDADLTADEGLGDVKSEDEVVDVESVFPEAKTASEKLDEEEEEKPARHHRFHKQRRRKPGPALPTSGLFSEDTLPMRQKSVKQREWAMRANRIVEILGRETRNNLMFCRSRKIGLDFNVASGQSKHLDMQLLTNNTLFEVFKFCSHLSRSTIHFLLEMLQTNFNFVFQENLQSYLYGKEKCLANQAHTEELLNTPIQFPEMYNVAEGKGEVHNEETPDDLPGEDMSDEFPYCKRIGVNLWSSTPGKKRSLGVLTHGALLEIFGFARRLCSKPRELMHDVLEHNFDVDLQDPTCDEACGLRRWLTVNRFTIKKSIGAIKTNMWLVEVVDLKWYGAATSPQHSCSETAPLLPTRTPKECTYDICKEIGLDLNLSGKSTTKRKLDPKSLTRGALFEVHNFVETKCNRYVPALYEILDYNFDLSSQRHRRVEFAWSVAARVLAMVRKGGRGGGYMTRVFELPFESEEGEVCKREEDEREIEVPEERGDDGHDDDVAFVRKLVPVDIDVEIQ